MSDIFNIANTADLPEGMIVARDSKTVRKGAELAEMLTGAGPVNIAQIQAAVYRTTGETPSQVTLRSWLQKGVEAGLIVKPTRQTYTAAEG